MNEIKESDWKIFRGLREIALQRFCERVLAEVTTAANQPGKTPHERYGDVYGLMMDRDKELARMFDDVSRSTALLQLCGIRYAGLLTDEEMSRFSPEVLAITQMR